MPTAVSLADGAALPSVDDTLPSKIKSIFEDPLSKAFFPDGVVTDDREGCEVSVWKCHFEYDGR